MKNFFFLILILSGVCGMAQQQATLRIKPTHSRSIEGHLELDRLKYFNLAANVNEMKNVLTAEQKAEYLNEMELTMGRRLGLVFSEVRWGNSIREDAQRPGHVDIDYLISKNNPTDQGLDDFIAAYDGRQNLALHDRQDGYPEFMDLYNNGTDHHMPGNVEAAAELAALLLKYEFTDFQRPNFYEIVNEPHWKFWGDRRFIDLHSRVKQKVDSMDLSVMVGGPCYSVSYYHKKEYDNLTQFTNFIDATDAALDFYSFHTYDYMKWEENDFVGSINSGLPLEGVFDAVSAFMNGKYGKNFRYVASEHGAYVSSGPDKEEVFEELGSTHFPGSGFEYEMEKRTIDNFIMVNGAIANTLTFMNHPHVVLKSVPFILLESSGWDTRYYSSLLVKENFSKSSSKWHESRLIDYFKFFQGVEGRRVEFWMDDPDIQSFAFVNDDQLILVLHNQSNVKADIKLDIEDFEHSPEEILVRKLYRKTDFRPVLSEDTYTQMPDLDLPGQGSMVVKLRYAASIPEDETYDE